MQIVVVRVICAGMADAAVRLSRVPCVGECIEFRERDTRRTKCVRVLTVRHYVELTDAPFSAQVTAEDITNGG